ncbi:MAG: histidinol-phosphatase HisJ family protein [Syntrophomonadales bacterium]
MLIDYHVHALAHGEYEYSSEWIGEYLRRAKDRNITQIGFSEHDWFISRIDPDKVGEVASKREFRELTARVGIEVDYKPERESEISAFLAQKPYDFAIGSVHHLGEWPFDHPDHKEGFEIRDIEEVYREYYSLIGRAVSSRLFDIVGHLDLIKVWGFKPVAHQENFFIKPLLHELRRSGMVVEINTGGLRKPVKEVYPSEKLLRDLFAHNIPITFGSDAHHPDDLGSGFSEAFRTVWKVGYRTMAGFSRRQNILIPITQLR